MSKTLAVTLLLLPAMTARAQVTPTPGELTPQSVTVEVAGDTPEQVVVPLLLYAPKAYDQQAEPWPLLLFLHGYGESGAGGDELDRVASHGPPSQVKAGKDLPFVIVSPQTPHVEGGERIRRAWRPEVLLPLLDQMEADLNIDRSRIYLTGLSMGGYGTWRLAAAAPERFAAAVPICGGGDPATMAEGLARVPLWAFHGGKDPVVPVAQSIDMVEAVRAAGGNARLTIYPEAGHDAWRATYDNPMFYDWLLGLRRAEQ